jgi:arylsulfatase A-like enzyme
MTDDQGYGDLACHGNPYVKTPALDKLYNESVRFTDFHVDPCCAPTRSALMTGCYSSRAGVWHTIGGRSLLKEDMTTIADVFSQNGYETGIFGKWHLGENYPFRPMDRGFKESIVHGGGGVGQSPDFWGNNYFDDSFSRRGQRIWVINVARDGKYEVHLNRWNNESGKRMVENRAGDKDLPLKTAWLKIGNIEQQKEITEDMKSAKFTIDLKAGSTCLQTALKFADEGRTSSTNCVYVEYLGESDGNSLAQYIPAIPDDLLRKNYQQTVIPYD